MNKVIHIGRLTKDVELRRTNSGKAVASFSMAVNKDFKNEQGNYDAFFFEYVAFGQTAEVISKYVHKGDKFGVIGHLTKRSYEKDGRTIWVHEIVVDGFEFLESKKPTEPSGGYFEQTDNTGSCFEPIDIPDEQLPF